MASFKQRLFEWWKRGLSPWVKFVYLVLLLNGLPAFVILMLIPHLTEQWFVWTVMPTASAQMLGVMYGSALLLVALGAIQPNWARARVTMVVITIFSVAATLVTFFNLDPFLKHPWVHLTYWLSMYLILFFVAPYVFWREERAHGGHLPVEVLLSLPARVVGALSLLVCGLIGLALLINPGFVSGFWPWMLTPLVGRILGVWYCSMAAAYAWTLWDGDWVRTRPLFWHMVPIGLLAALVPLLHGADIRPGAAVELTLYLSVALLAVVGGLVAILSHQRAPLVEARRGQS